MGRNPVRKSYDEVEKVERVVDESLEKTKSADNRSLTRSGKAYDYLEVSLDKNGKNLKIKKSKELNETVTYADDVADNKFDRIMVENQKTNENTVNMTVGNRKINENVSYMTQQIDSLTEQMAALAQIMTSSMQRRSSRKIKSNKSVNSSDSSKIESDEDKVEFEPEQERLARIDDNERNLEQQQRFFETRNEQPWYIPRSGRLMNPFEDLTFVRKSG